MQLPDPWTSLRKQSVFGSNVHLRTVGAAVVFGGVVDSTGPVVVRVILNENNNDYQILDVSMFLN